MKKKILLCALSFIVVALFSCGIAFLPNWNPKPSTPPSDIGQGEGVFETEAATTPTNTSGTWIDSGRRGTSFGGGSGTASDPYIISNAQQLAYLAYMVNKGNDYSGEYFEQTANIDLSAYYWEPIIGTTLRSFSGNYTANPFGVITNLYIKSDYDYTGLFGRVENATISNIGISGGYIEGRRYTGGLVGHASDTATITNCYNTSNVTSTVDTISSNYPYAGGLVGYASGTTTIINSYNTGNVTSTIDTTSFLSRSSYAGGLVGYSGGTTTIINSYNTGNVTSTVDTTSSLSLSSYVGGLAGYAGGDVNMTNCYNTGNVTNTSSGSYSYTGGLVGDVNDETTITIENSYNIGNVTSNSSSGSSRTGGLVGRLYAGSLSCCHNIGDISAPSSAWVGAIVGMQSSFSVTFTKCYYYCEGVSGGVGDIDVSGTSENVNLLGSDIIFRSQSDYTNTALWTEPFWDFDNSWKIVSYINGSYPVLQGFTEYTLTINPNGGSINNQTRKASPGLTTEISDPTRDGYTFTGWRFSGEGLFSDLVYTFDVGNATLTAQWAPNTYSVKFYRNHSSSDTTTSTQSGFTYDQSKALQANPWTKTGYTFKGWSTSRTATTATYTDGQSVSTLTSTNGGTVNLYAVWAISSYKLTVNPNGGTWSGSTSSQSFTQNYNTTKSISSPSRTGYSLGAWVLDGGGSISTFGKLHDSYTDPFFMDNNNSTSEYNNEYNGTVTHEYIAASNTDIELPTGARILRIKNTGTSSPGLGGFTNFLESYPNAVFYTIIYAKIPKGYSIRFASNATGTNSTRTWLTSQVGTGDWQVYIHKIQCGSSGEFRTTNFYYIDGGANGTASNPVVWDVAYFGTYDATGLSVSGSSTGNLTYTYDDSNNSLVALWNINSYTLTVNPNSGTWNGSSSSQTFTQNYNTTKAIANPVRYGYYFDGWTLSGSGSLNGTTFTFGAGNTTLTAQWIETWAVNYTVPSGKGTEEDPYQVDSASDLAYFAYKTQIQGQVSYDYIVLTDDIDLAGYDWMPIGTGRYVVSGVQACFSGTFDGQGHTISNLNINVLGQQVLDEYGLFGLTDINAVLKNFTILSGQVNGFNTSTGAVVGYTWRSTIDNVTNYANVTGNNYVGGIIGSMQRTSKISNCFNYGNVQGINYVGGVVGGTEDSTETRSIVGVTNMGQVAGHSQVGGIIGRAYHVTVESAYNGYTASVTATTRYAGGVVGYLMNGSTVLKSVNTADVAGLECVAGLVGGAVNGGSLTTSYSEGLISARGSSVTEAGTLVGSASSTMAIADCYFKGTSNKSIGTYYGSKYDPATISNCYVKLNGTLSKTAGSFDNWTIVSGVNDNDPIQKELFYLAGYTGGDALVDEWLG